MLSLFFIKFVEYHLKTPQIWCVPDTLLMPKYWCHSSLLIWTASCQKDVRFMAGQGKTLSKKKQDQGTRYLIGEQIRRHRTDQAMTQEDLVQKIGRNLFANSLSRYENGETEMGIVTFLAVASALKVKPNDLIPRKLITSSEPIIIQEQYGKLSSDRKYIVNQIIFHTEQQATE